MVTPCHRRRANTRAIFSASRSESKRHQPLHLDERFWRSNALTRYRASSNCLRTSPRSHLWSFVENAEDIMRSMAQHPFGSAMMIAMATGAFVSWSSREHQTQSVSCLVSTTKGDVQGVDLGSSC